MNHPILGPKAIDALRSSLTEFTPNGVLELIGPVGQSALDRGDLLGVARELRGSDDSLATLIKLFLLGKPVGLPEGRAALAPLDLAEASALFAIDGDRLRARVEIRPYAEAQGPTWWVVSDFGSDVAPGPLPQDHVLGIGAASLNLAQLTMRTPVERALDVGTGCGVQSLHLSRHAGSVTATDLSSRALAMAATTAALSAVRWDLRQGSGLEPVRGERFDLVVANPPFVVSPGDSAVAGYDYRDSGLAGDEFCHRLVNALPSVLTPGGAAQLLANWAITADQTWDERVNSWLDGSGCDAWVWQREVAGPGEYVALWLRDAGELPGTPRWAQRYDHWLDWMDAAGIVAVGMGTIALWNSGSLAPTVVCEDVPQAVSQPAGAEIAAWLPRQRFLANADDTVLLGSRLRAAVGLVRLRHDLLAGESPGGEPLDGAWQTALEQLRQSAGMQWEVETDAAVAGLVAACNGRIAFGTLIEMLATALHVAADDLARDAVPVIRDLVSRGFLLPEGARSVK